MEDNRRNEPARPEERPAPRRKKRWPTVVAVLIVAAAVAGIMVYDRYVGRLLRSEPYQAALRLIQNDAKAQDELGTPIKDATSILNRVLPSGSIYSDAKGSGEATLLFRVSGPKGQADALVKARRTNGKWDVNSVDLTLASGNKLAVEVPAEAPLFNPGAGGGVEPPKPTPPGPCPARICLDPKRPGLPVPKGRRLPSGTSSSMIFPSPDVSFGFAGRSNMVGSGACAV